jgi:Ca2+-binding RTX toxin-like protein
MDGRGRRWWTGSISTVACLFAVSCPALAQRPAALDNVSVSGSSLVLETVGDHVNVVDIQPPGSFGYRVFDGSGGLTAGPGCESVSPQVALCSPFVTEVVVHGSPGGDLIGLWGLTIPVHAEGGPGDDLLEAGQANDSIEGGEGNDGLVGGVGDDRLDGQQDDDDLHGGEGADTLDGGSDDDMLSGGAGSGDVLLGQQGADLLRSGAGDNTLAGGPGTTS